MKNILFFLIMVNLLQLLSCNRSSTGKPSAKVDKTQIDIGKFDIKDSVCGFFEIANIGKAPLKILDIETDCSCTIASWNRNEIREGQTDTIKLIIVKKEEGFFKKKAIVKLNDERVPIILVITGKIVSGD